MGLTFFDSILALKSAHSLFCSFCGEDRGPRLVAYLEKTVHPLPTGEEVAVGLRAFFVQFWGSGPPFLAGREVGGVYHCAGHCLLMPPTSLWPQSC
jgi:hypothetical protein